MPQQSTAALEATAPGSAAEAVQQLTQHALNLAARLSQLTASLQQSSSSQVNSTLQHLAVYDEAVQSLQVTIDQFLFTVHSKLRLSKVQGTSQEQKMLSQANATATIVVSDEMQEACMKLYEELATVDVLKKQVQHLRSKVEQLEVQITAKLKVCRQRAQHAYLCTTCIPVTKSLPMAGLDLQSCCERQQSEHALHRGSEASQKP